MVPMHANSIDRDVHTHLGIHIFISCILTLHPSISCITSMRACTHAKSRSTLQRNVKT